MKIPLHHTTVLAAAGALLIGVSATAQAANLPELHHAGQIEYLSGGIGKDESDAIKAAGKHWPLMLEFAVKDKQHADFAADVKVVVLDAKRHAALRTEANGPLMLAKLTPGSYAVDATLGDKTLHEKVLIKRGTHARLTFVWPTESGNRHS